MRPVMQTPWSIILAAGKGRRLSSVTGGVPKQFWSPDGRRTLLGETAERIAPLTSPERTLTVIDQSHRPYAEEIRQEAPIGRVLSQFMDRGTAAGVLLGLSEVADLDAIVVLTPSDHGVARPSIFRRAIRQAIAEIHERRAAIVLFGAPATSPIGDYGWIVPHLDGDIGRTRLSRVASFVEKPSADVARLLLAQGGAWNTMVMVARVGALLDRYDEHLPSLTRVFHEARQLAGTERPAFLNAKYPTLPHADFSRDVLGQTVALHCAIWPTTIGWTDLGTPERLERWLAVRDARRSSQPAGVGEGHLVGACLAVAR
jgi:mannose-1-phosphate guanylyltransferase